MGPGEQRFLEVVQGLCDEATGGKLIALGTSAAFIAMPDNTAAAVISAERGPLEELEEHLRALVKGNPGADLKLVIVGGDARHRELLGRVQPRLMMRRVVQTFALGDDRQPWAGNGSRLDSLTGRVLAEVAAREIPREVDREALRATIETPTPEAIESQEERRGFVTKLAQGRPHATMAIVTSYAVAFALAQLWGGGEFVPTFARMGGVTEAALSGEPWRLLSASWLHLGWLHLIVNGYVMIVLGGFLERLLGWRRMVMIYVASALGGGIASALFSQAPLSVGASGAIWGLLGTAVALAWRPGQVIPPAVLPVIRRNAMVNLVVNLAVSFLPQVDLMAHLGGGVVGLALGLAGLSTRGLAADGADTSDRRLQPWVLGVILVHAGAFALALATGRPWALLRMEEPRTVELRDADATIAVPAQLVEQLGDQLDGPGPWVFGDLLHDPLAIQVDVARHDGPPMTDAELRIGVEQLREAELPHDPELTPTGRRRELTDARYPTIEERYTAAAGITLVQWFQIRPEGHVRFEGYLWTEHPEVEPTLRAALDSIELR